MLLRTYVFTINHIQACCSFKVVKERVLLVVNFNIFYTSLHACLRWSRILLCCHRTRLQSKKCIFQRKKLVQILYCLSGPKEEKYSQAKANSLKIAWWNRNEYLFKRWECQKCCIDCCGRVEADFGVWVFILRGYILLKTGLFSNAWTVHI